MSAIIPAPVMPSDTAFTFSQSSLQDFVDCPRRFQLRYLQDLHWPAVDAEPLPQVERRQQDALLFHRLVQQHYMGMSSEALAAMAGSPELTRWWAHFAAAAPDLPGWRLYTEKALAARVGSHRLICKYDLLAIRGGKARIYDWKTFARRPRNEWLAARLQTKVYPAVLIQAGAELNGSRPFAPGDVSMTYWFAEFPSDPATFEYGDQQYARDRHAVDSLIGEISAAGSFPLTADAEHCRFCTYRSLCDRGQGAGIDPDIESENVSEGGSDNGLEQIGEAQF